MRVVCQAAPQAPACPPPVFPSFTAGGKHCPIWSEKSTCLNNSFHYLTFAEAWTACVLTADCDLIVHHSEREGFYMMHRNSDPDDSRWESMPVVCQAVCYNQTALDACTAWGTYSKEDNGCRGYAQGRAAGAHSCDKCGSLSRAYAPCDLAECLAMCGELYASKTSEVGRCRSGCE